MKKDLTSSDIQRKNILNNKFALEEVAKELQVSGILFDNVLRFTKKQVATYFDIDERTIERYLESFSIELNESGYEVISGNRLKLFKDQYDRFVNDQDSDVTDIDVGNISKAPKIGLFTFRSFLNIGMLLTESERAKQLRSLVLDIVIDTLNSKIGESTKLS